MPFYIRRRALLATATLGSASVLLPAPVRAYGLYQTSRTMQAPVRQDGEFIWQWLLLLIDASNSMRKPFDRMSFYDMQVEAMARALVEPCVAGRLIGPPGGRTAIGAVLWSASKQQQIAVHWHVIRSIEEGGAHPPQRLPQDHQHDGERPRQSRRRSRGSGKAGRGSRDHH